MAKTLSPTVKFQGFDSNGDPLSGGKLYTYRTGTTTNKTTYSNSTGTANANPVILDSRGECDLWLDTDEAYTFVLKTSADVTIWSKDAITPPVDQVLRTDLSASSGSSLVGFLQSGTGSVATTVQAKARETYSPADKGAAADGVTDDLAEFQNLISSVSAGGVVNLKPQGSYYVETDNDSEILINKPLTWMQHGALISAKANAGTGPHDVIRASSTLGSTLNTDYWDWTETILQGVNTLNVVTTLAENDYALIALGDDPTDATGTKHYYKIVRILSNAAGVLTIDDIIPWNINTTSHTIYKLISLVNGLVMDGFRGKNIQGTAGPGICLALRTLLGAKIGQVVVEDASIGVSVGQGCEGIEIESISGNVKTFGGAGSHNRIFTCWGSQNIKVGSIKAYTTEDKNVLYHEGGVRNVRYGSVEIHRYLGGAPTTQVMHFNNADNIEIEQYVEVSNQGARPGPGFGGTAGFSPDGSVPVNLCIRNGFFYTPSINRIGCQHYDKICWNKKVYDRPRTDEYVFHVVGAVVNQITNICRGHVRRAWVWANSITDLTGLRFRNSNADVSAELSASVVANTWAELTSAGNLHLLNSGTAGILFSNLNYPQKQIRLNSGATADFTMRIRVEYFPDDEHNNLTADATNYFGHIVWDPANLVDGAGETSAAIPVASAAFGDAVIVYPPYDLQGIQKSGDVSSAGNVKIRIQNETGGAINLASGLWTVQVVSRNAPVSRSWTDA